MNIIVVGAGISGLSTAWALTKQGVSVTLVEQGPVPNPLGASGDQHRIIRRAYGGQGGYQRRIGAAFDAWDALWDDLGESHYENTGFLLLSQTPGDEGEQYRDGLADGGYPFEQMSGGQTQDRYPFIDGNTLRFGAFSTEGGVLLCQKIAIGLRSWLRQNGAEVREHTRVLALDRDIGSVTLEGGQMLHADKIIVTAGAWTLGLLPELASSLTTYRTAVAYLTPPEDLRSHWENAPVILDVGGPVDGYVLPPVAGTGLKVGAGVHKRRSDPNVDRSPAPGEGEVIRDLFSPPFCRIAEYGIADVVTCAYTFTRDEHFYLQDMGKVTAVSACSGHGYKFGAVVGQKLAEAALSGEMETARIWLEARD
ncbi:sarcosine oxidase [Roseibium hamelinense]|uniref:Sarcosine oxidase n=1 Tax=Roseibium hamelinense TaxID=150831 RepID=A0A562T968_9HYPH|nr:FAD-dependent oxidoreductase [Roseibium hamelinense]MTI45551.1 FAD-dependent oxidoreductase [Roseibium hamelinense]TWI90072.1 sarcosine oxidase [Roseibium hamelinense]